MTSLLVSIVLAVMLLAECVGFDYCTMNCGPSSKNTLCEYPSERLPACWASDKVELGLNEKQKTILLSAHNDMRQLLATGSVGGYPQAADMRQLTWDDEAATFAQRWAAQCAEGHDTCRKSKTGESLGQNIAQGTYSSQSAEDNKHISALVKMWFNEYSQVPPEAVDRFDIDYLSAGHFTQMAWAKTSAVGCGMSIKQNGEGRALKLVCNYRVAGNMRRERIYMKGIPCSKCPLGTMCSMKYQGLCSSSPNSHRNFVVLLLLQGILRLVYY